MRLLLILVTCLCVGLFAATWFFREAPQVPTTVENLRMQFSEAIVLQGPKEESKQFYVLAEYAKPAGRSGGSILGSVPHGSKWYPTPTNPDWTMETRMLCLVGVDDDQVEWLVLGIPPK